MTPDEYIADVLRTESGGKYTPKHMTDVMLRRVQFGPEVFRLLHAGMGMTTESGEFVDALKKHIYYGKPIDRTNLIEELGDQLWYVAVAIDALGTSFEDVMRINIEKLRERYGDKFTDEAAVNRDLEAERKVLEDGQ
jgi:NTP pyrophosphatase (non-canonical NTP hydrolase)